MTGALWLVDGGVTVAKRAVRSQTPDALRTQPEGQLHQLKHLHEGLRNKEVYTSN